MLGFDRGVFDELPNGLDRDFVADTLYACSMLGVHLSRIGEELILWASTEFGFVTLDDGSLLSHSKLPPPSKRLAEQMLKAFVTASLLCEPPRIF